MVKLVKIRNRLSAGAESFQVSKVVLDVIWTLSLTYFLLLNIARDVGFARNTVLLPRR
jgi:hypothetical protein